MCFVVNVEMWWCKFLFLDCLCVVVVMGYLVVEFWFFKNKDIDVIVELVGEFEIEIV